MADCPGCELRLCDIHDFVKDDVWIKTFLLQHNLIAKEVNCTSCGGVVPFNYKSKLNLFRCQKKNTRAKKKKKCRFKRSIFHKSFFSQAKIKPEKIMRLLSHWLILRPPIQNIIVNELDMQPGTIVDWLSYAREVTMHWAKKNSRMIGGEGKVVEISQCRLGRGTCNGGPLSGQWVIGGLETQEDDPHVFIVPVETAHSRDSLLNVIIGNVLPGSVVVSRMWSEYGCMKDEGFLQSLVNINNIHIKDPEFGIHTQNIDRVLRNLSTMISNFGRKKEHLEGYISEFLFKRKFRHKQLIHHFFVAAGELYPPLGNDLNVTEIH